MNILYVLQQSIYNNKGKGLTSDSNINMFLDLASQMYKKDPGIHFYCLIALLEDFEDLKQPVSVFGVKTNYDGNQLYDKPNVTFVPYKFPVNAFTNRYSFDPQYFAQTYDVVEKFFDISIDIVWNNIIELTRNMKTTLRQINKNPKFISCNYWLDAPVIGQGKVDEDISYDGRQFDGFECSDLCVFTCESTKSAGEENAYGKFNPRYINSILKKSVIGDFGYLQKNIDETFNKLADNAITLYKKPTILFLNRLSGINYTHHQEFIDAVNELGEERQDFQVFFTNPSHKVSTEWLKDNIKAYVEIAETPLTRDQYFELLYKSHISCHLFLIELYGGCSHRESIASNNITITPPVNEYRRIGGKDYQFYCKKDFSDLKDVLSKAIDAVKEGKGVPDDVLERNYESSFEFVTDIVIKDLKDLCV